ncbi:16S rRNA (uracil(1498)-N(3))-methyltransferase [Plasmodiophora brassicae]
MLPRPGTVGTCLLVGRAMGCAHHRMRWAASSVRTRVKAKRRVFVDANPGMAGSGSSFVPLPVSECHHVANVLRLQPPAEVLVTFGDGRWLPGTLHHQDASGTKRKNRQQLGVLISPGANAVVSAEPLPVTLGIAPPKAEAWCWIVEKCTELGVDRVVPLVAQFGTGNDQQQRLTDKGVTVMKQALKQCERAWTMPVDTFVPVQPFLSMRRRAAGDILLVAMEAEPHRDGDILTVLDALDQEERAGDRPAIQRACLAVGPEGGWSDEEKRALSEARQAGQPRSVFSVGLGRYILTTEAAAVMGTGLLCAWMERRLSKKTV